MTKGKDIPFNQVSDQDTSIAMFTEGDHSTLDDGEAQRPSAIEMTNADPQAPQVPYTGQYHQSSSYPHHLLQRLYQNHQQPNAYSAAPLPYHTNLVPRYNNSIYSVPSVYPAPAYNQPDHTAAAPYPQQALYHSQPQHQHHQQQHHHQQQQQQTQQHAPLAYAPHLHTAYHPTADLQTQPTPVRPIASSATFEAFLDPLPIDKPAAASVHVFCPHCKQHANTKVKSAPIVLFVVLFVLLLGPFIGAIVSVILYKTGHLVRHVHSCEKCGQRLSKGCGFKSKAPKPTVRLAVAGWSAN